MPVPPLVEDLPHDSVGALVRAARSRFHEALQLSSSAGSTAIYLMGYSVEMLLAAGVFRKMGFTVDQPIDRDTRSQYMKRFRKRPGPDGKPLMGSEPHPLPGWARCWIDFREAEDDADETFFAAVHAHVDLVWRHWRPDLRYKALDADPAQVEEVHAGADWFVRNVDRLL